MEALQIARFFAAKTDAQLKTFFVLNDAQVILLRAKLTDMVATGDKIRTAVGQ